MVDDGHHALRPRGRHRVLSGIHRQIHGLRDDERQLGGQGVPEVPSWTSRSEHGLQADPFLYSSQQELKDKAGRITYEAPRR